MSQTNPANLTLEPALADCPGGRVPEKLALNRRELTAVRLPEGVTAVGKVAFAGCENLQQLQLPSTLKTIGEGAFHGTALEQLVIPEGVTALGDRAFAYCKRLRSVTLPATLRSVGERAFEHCPALEEIVLPQGLVCLRKYAFRDCTALRRVTFPPPCGSTAGRPSGAPR